MKRLILILLLVFVSPIALADAKPLDEIFDPTSEDLSLFYLGSIFGTVSNNLASDVHSNVVIVGQLFSIFNEVALTVGIILVIYSVVVGTMHTAHSGRPMGERWSTLWLPIRIAIGMALLLPNSYGYCLAQVVVMQVTVWGIGAADTVWDEAVDYISNGGAIYAQQEGDDAAAELSAAYDSFSSVFSNLACVRDHNDNAADVLQYQAMQYGEFIDTDADATTVYNIVFGTPNDTTGLGQECGRIGLKSEDQVNVVLDLANSISSGGDDLLGKVVHQGAWSETQYNDLSAMLVAYKEEMKSITPLPPLTRSTDYEKYKRWGWLMAGAYYRAFSMSKAVTVNVNYPTSFTGPNDTETTNHKLATDRAEDFLNDARDKVIASGVASGAVAQGILAGIGNVSSSNVDFPKWMEKIKIDKAFKAMAKPVFDAIDSIGSVKGDDPFSKAIDLGKKMMQAAAAIIGILTVANVVLGLATKWCSGKLPTGEFLTPIQNLLNIVGIGVGSLLYVQGASLAIYLPLIPFIIFFISGLGWMISVIEAMVAAPLVALGLIWPEAQNEVLGKADPAVMLFLNLFLRPVLMIFGLLGGLLLVWMGFTLFSIGFRLMLGSGFIGYEPMFGWVALGLIYIMLLITIAQKCFSLIHHVPDKVLSWIGDTSQGIGGAEEALQQGRTGVQTGGELGFAGAAQVAKGAGKGAEAGMAAYQKLKEKVNEKKDQKKQ